MPCPNAPFLFSALWCFTRSKCPTWFMGISNGQVAQYCPEKPYWLGSLVYDHGNSAVSPWLLCGKTARLGF
ncbi:hypothetical protein EV426DRAFT_193471 [Tirmania nivea]|nr:hypothetical protein EV426DRAFT_193471 [Tirmania nivea]